MSAPTTKPAAAIVLAASACARPLTSGTCAGPLDTTRATVVPPAATVPAAGAWATTTPAGAKSSGRAVVAPTAKPAARMSAWALLCTWPTTFGTTPGGGGPEATTRLTAELGATSVPAAGFWLSTDPAGVVAPGFSAVLPTVSVAEVTVAAASGCVWPTTSGTVTGVPTWIEYSWSAKAPWVSCTFTMTFCIPSCAAVGVHCTTPVLGSIVIPAGAVGSENVSTSPASGSVAPTP